MLLATDSFTYWISRWDLQVVRLQIGAALPCAAVLANRGNKEQGPRTRPPRRGGPRRRHDSQSCCAGSRARFSQNSKSASQPAILGAVLSQSRRRWVSSAAARGDKLAAGCGDRTAIQCKCGGDGVAEPGRVARCHLQFTFAAFTRFEAPRVAHVILECNSP